jgi:signal transduction histidine kinase
MKEVVINLLLNASQAFEKPGSIVIEAEDIRLKQVIRDFSRIKNSENENAIYDIRDIVLAKGSQALKISISDTGPGIPVHLKDRIFAPFFTTKINGTGLGLTFVQRVVNQHGGIISVDSEEGLGSKFTILLPLTNNEQGRL